MSAIERRLTNLEESLAPTLRPRLAFASSKAHAKQLRAEEDAERAKNPTVAAAPLIILRWLESKEEAATANLYDPLETPLSGTERPLFPG